MKVRSALLALAVALITPAAAHAQQPVATIDGDPLQVSADGLGGLGVKFVNRDTGEFFDPDVPIGHAGLELREGTEVSSVSDTSTRTTQSGPNLDGSALYSDYVVTLPTPLEVVERVSYASGTRAVAVHYDITNRGDAAVDFNAGELADIYLAGSDTGRGVFLAGPPRMIAGQAADGSLSGLLESTAWTHFQESYFGDVFGNFDFGHLNDQADPTEQDNGVGAEWDFTQVAPGDTRSIDVTWSFAAAGSAPPSPTITASVSGTTVTLSGSAEPGAKVTVYDRGTAVGSTQAGTDGAWSLTLNNVAAGSHAYSASATDAAGNVSPVSAPANVTVQGPTPTPTPTPTPVPPPVLGKKVNVENEGGTVLLKLPGSNRFVALTSLTQIPTGTIVDTTRGRIGITSAADNKGHTGSADFYDGLFQVTQTTASKPITDLTLVQALSCSTKGKASAAATKPKTRKLWGDGSGNFRTRGRYSSATVRGTIWLVQDTCTTTVTKVKRGVVTVADNVKHKTVVLRAPHSYTARKKRH